MYCIICKGGGSLYIVEYIIYEHLFDTSINKRRTLCEINWQNILIKVTEIYSYTLKGNILGLPKRLKEYSVGFCYI
jgi:hypothetical protein